MSFEQQQLDYSLKYWDFEEAEKILRFWSKIDVNILPAYCHFLADTGHLNKVKEVIESVVSSPYENKLMYTKEFNVCKYLKRLHFQKLSEYANKSGFFSEMYYYSIYNELDSLYALVKNIVNKINQDTTSEENMIFNFAVNRLIDGKCLDANTMREVINHISTAKNMNLKRKKYMLKSIVDYAISSKEISENFFNLNANSNSHVHTTLIPLIHIFSNVDEGADLLMDKVYYLIKKSNDLRVYSEDKKPKVAICISGMFKSDMTSLKSIVTSLEQPLDADVFVHTWDRQQEWSGDMRRYNFWQRVFGISNFQVPKNLLNLNFIEHHYPDIYRCLLSTIFSKIDKGEIEKNINVEAMLIENEEDFLETYKVDEGFKTRGVYNQVKMFYGMYKSFELAVNKEANEGFKYDYIIRLRPDAVINSSSLNYESLRKLNNSSLAVPSGFGWGLADGMFYANRSVYERAVGLWREMLLARKLSPFIGFEGWDAHKLFGLWLLKQDIRPVACCFSGSLAIGESLKVPNLLNALQHDCSEEMYSKFPEETEWLSSFLSDKAK